MDNPKRKALEHRFRLWAFYTYYERLLPEVSDPAVRFGKALALSCQPVPAGAMERWDTAMAGLRRLRKKPGGQAVSGVAYGEEGRQLVARLFPRRSGVGEAGRRGVPEDMTGEGEA